VTNAKAATGSVIHSTLTRHAYRWTERHTQDGGFVTGQWC
jgi:hypothetical protein